MSAGKPQQMSLEAQEEEAARTLAEEEEEETRFDELIDVMAEKEPMPLEERPVAIRGDEFVCTGCHLVRPRSCLGDEERRLCRDCVQELGVRPGRPATSRLRFERRCPACGETLMIPDRENAACGFFCPGCGVHLRQRGGHLHLEWNHTYHPGLGPHPRPAGR